MKTYAYLFACIVAFSACRSSRSHSESYDSDNRNELHTDSTRNSLTQTDISKEQTNNTSENKDVQESKTQNKETSISANETSEGYKRNTSFADDGRISSVQEEWWSTGRNELESSHTRSVDVSIDNSIIETDISSAEASQTATTVDEKSTSVSIVESKISGDKQEQNNSDSRWIQGCEWLYIIVPIAIIGLIWYLFKHKKK